MENNPSAIDKLFDENNNDNIVLFNSKGEPTEFEQAALIPLEGKVYAILSLAVPNEDIAEDEGIVFSIETREDGERSLRLVVDDGIIERVFEIYESLLDNLPEDDETDEEDLFEDDFDDQLDDILGDILDEDDESSEKE
ncbi:MAG: DUF1292 domain-containing protein [Clostridia bacterium]|nr:DUF1292 domain-containing protein [Clostridia bacterium]